MPLIVLLLPFLGFGQSGQRLIGHMTRLRAYCCLQYPDIHPIVMELYFLWSDISCDKRWFYFSLEKLLVVSFPKEQEIWFKEEIYEIL